MIKTLSFVLIGAFCLLGASCSSSNESAQEAAVAKDSPSYEKTNNRLKSQRHSHFKTTISDPQ